MSSLLAAMSFITTILNMKSVFVYQGMVHAMMSIVALGFVLLRHCVHGVGPDVYTRAYFTAATLINTESILLTFFFVNELIFDIIFDRNTGFCFK